MGIYVFKKQVLCKLLNEVYPNDNDFGGEIIPKAAKDYKVHNGHCVWGHCVWGTLCMGGHV